jgi:hypothetical protein
MVLETITLDAAIKVATPAAKKLFAAKLNPLIETKIVNYFKTKAALSRFKRESIKYLARLTGQCSILNTIAFQNAPKRLESLYIPLTLQSDSKTESILIDDKVEIFQKHSHILINDSAGMGKSTLSKRIILNVIDKAQYIPVFIELRQLQNKPIEEQVTDLFGVKCDNPITFLKQLPLLYVFDGMDEVANDQKKDILKFIKEFVDQIDDSKILLTSRQETYLSEFYSFKRYSIQPLTEKEAFNLLRKCDSTGKICEKLIEGVKSNRGSGIREFMSTPLYVSLLFCSYRYKTVIPQKKHLFYSQVYEALFESHDLSKEVGYVRPKYSKLDSAEFHTILRRIGFWCLKNNGKIEFQLDELEIVVSGLLSGITGLSTKAPNFVKDLIKTVPLFVKEGSSVRWSHKSLMEYFASMFICHDAKVKQKDLMLNFFNSPNWSSYSSIFELCADIDFSSFRSSIVKKVLNEFIQYHDSAYKNITNPRIKKQDIEMRISLTFSSGNGIQFLSNFESNILDDIKFFEKVKSECGHHCGRRVEMIMGFGEPSRIIHYVGCENRNRSILKILEDKSPELFIKIDPMHSKVSDYLSKTTLKKNKLYIVNENSKSILNNSVHFSNINKILTLNTKKFLNIEAVKSEVLKINTDDSNGINELLDGF